MRDAPRHALGRRVLAARASHRENGRYAELDRLANGQVHHVGGDDRLHERDGPRAFPFDRIVASHAQDHVVAIDVRDRRRIFAAGAGEERHRFADTHPERLREVTRRRFRKRVIGAWNRRTFCTDKDTWRHHDRCYDSRMRPYSP